MEGRLHRIVAPITSVTCRISFVRFISRFLYQIGEWIFINKCIKCNSQNVAISTNEQWKTTPTIREHYINDLEIL